MSGTNSGRRGAHNGWIAACPLVAWLGVAPLGRAACELACVSACGLADEARIVECVTCVYNLLSFCLMAAHVLHCLLLRHLGRRSRLAHVPTCTHSTRSLHRYTPTTKGTLVQTHTHGAPSLAGIMRGFREGRLDSSHWSLALCSSASSMRGPCAVAHAHLATVALAVCGEQHVEDACGALSRCGTCPPTRRAPR